MIRLRTRLRRARPTSHKATTGTPDFAQGYDGHARMKLVISALYMKNLY